MSTILSDSTPRARKPHKCWYCHESIPVGETYNYRTGITEGDFFVTPAIEETVAESASVAETLTSALTYTGAMVFLL